MNNGDGVTFSHIGIFVHDLAAMERFYVDLLDFTVTDRGTLSRNGQTRDVVFLSRDPDEHHQIVLAGGRPRQIDFNTINQISMKVSSLEELCRFHRRMCGAGRDGIDPVSHGNAVSVYLPDPEGNRVEIYWDTPWYVSQPLVESVDLSLPRETLLATIKLRASALPGFQAKSERRKDMVERMRRVPADAIDRPQAPVSDGGG